MGEEAGQARGGSRALWWAVWLGAHAGVVAALTLMFHASRAVMDVGGSCASGGAYEISTPCPQGVGGAMTMAIFGGFLLVGVAIAANAQVDGPDIIWLTWPGLFLSLAWNFWSYGLADVADRGVDVGWVICGVLFTLMGGAPLIGGILMALKGDTPPRVASAAASVGRGAVAVSVPPGFRADATSSASSTTSTATADPAGEAGADPIDEDLVDALERLSRLHQAGSLTTAEFADAKRRVLEGRR